MREKGVRIKHCERGATLSFLDNRRNDAKIGRVKLTASNFTNRPPLIRTYSTNSRNEQTAIILMLDTLSPRIILQFSLIRILQPRSPVHSGRAARDMLLYAVECAHPHR